VCADQVRERVFLHFLNFVFMSLYKIQNLQLLNKILQKKSLAVSFEDTKELGSLQYHVYRPLFAGRLGSVPC
jgi:hypothetical protein